MSRLTSSFTPKDPKIQIFNSWMEETNRVLEFGITGASELWYGKSKQRSKIQRLHRTSEGLIRKFANWACRWMTDELPDKALFI